VATDPAASLANLRKVPLFRGLSRETLLELNRRSEESRVEAGTTIITEGEPGEAMYVLLTGRAAVYRDGTQVAELVPGDYFGEMALIDHEPRCATIVALEATSLLMIHAADFDALLRLPAVAHEVLRGLAALVRSPWAVPPGEDEPAS
jgi:CRP-like cAMP-binding protein